MKKLKDRSNFLLIIMAVVLPLIALLPRLAPASKTWYGYEVAWYADWKTAVWAWSTMALPVVISLVALAATNIKKRKELAVFLIVATYVAGWQLYTAILPERYLDPSNIIMYLFIVTAVLALFFLVKIFKSPSEREKKEELLYIIDQLRKEDLPQLFVGLQEIESSAVSMRQADFMDEWKNILKREVEMENLVIMSTIEKLDSVKTKIR